MSTDRLTPIGVEDVIRYNRSLLRKAEANLANAKRRGDSIAEGNIIRKMELYKFTIHIAELYRSDTDRIVEDILKLEG